MRSDFVEKDVLSHVLFALTEPNRLVCRVCLETGLRVDDALSLPVTVLDKSTFTITEQKTGKRKKCRLSEGLKADLRCVCGDVYIFPHRLDQNKHRTRQAVYVDLKRVCKFFRVKENVTPHTMRKAYAVDMMRRYGDLRRVAEALNHEPNSLVTMLYALADAISKGAVKIEKKKR